jgi:hypothetical protein
VKIKDPGFTPAPPPPKPKPAPPKKVVAAPTPLPAGPAPIVLPTTGDVGNGGGGTGAAPAPRVAPVSTPYLSLGPARPGWSRPCGFQPPAPPPRVAVSPVSVHPLHAYNPAGTLVPRQPSLRENLQQLGLALPLLSPQNAQTANAALNYLGVPPAPARAVTNALQPAPATSGATYTSSPTYTRSPAVTTGSVLAPRPTYPGTNPAGLMTPAPGLNGFAPAPAQTYLPTILQPAPSMAPATNAQGNSNSGGGGDPEFEAWYAAFMAEHDGQTPEAVYGGGEDALAKAWFDKQWMDKNWSEDRPVTQYDWQNTYGKRLNAYYGDGGGGYGGGGYGGGDSSGLPPSYVAGFTSTLGAPDAYYTADRGGAAQQQTDFTNLQYLWQNATGKPFQPEDWEAVWRNVAGYKAAMGNATPVDFSDVYNYLASKLVGATKNAPPTQLQTGNW